MSVEAGLMNDQQVYETIMMVSTLDNLKTNILVILAHLPFGVNAAQLTRLLGYSQKSRMIYRGVLTELEDTGLINLSRNSNEYNILLQREHPAVRLLGSLALSFGRDYTDRLIDLLEENP